MLEEIRLARPSDSEALLKIYAPFVENTSVTFEIQVPTAEEFSNRIHDITQEYPYLLYCVGEQIVGYAYAARHRQRAAYAYDVDTSIYIEPNYHGRGIAARLYQRLFSILAEQGIYNLYAAYTEPNEKSRRFHEKMGFRPVGTFHQTGYKFGRWHDVTWMEKSLQEHNVPQGEVKSVKALPDGLMERILEGQRTLI